MNIIIYSYYTLLNKNIWNITYVNRLNGTYNDNDEVETNKYIIRFAMHTSIRFCYHSSTYLYLVSIIHAVSCN